MSLRWVTNKLILPQNYVKYDPQLFLHPLYSYTAEQQMSGREAISVRPFIKKHKWNSVTDSMEKFDWFHLGYSSSNNPSIDPLIGSLKLEFP
jgi:hypothetical protein